MRLSLALALLSALAVPAAAHADTTFTYTPNGGSPITFTANAADTYDDSPYGVQVFQDDSQYLYAYFYSAYDDSLFAGDGYGNFDIYLEVYDYNTGQYLADDFDDGVQLYTETANGPVFLPGTYILPVDPIDAPSYGIGGTLVIGSTPEPSSFILLGTGALSLAGAARRRFRQA